MLQNRLDVESLTYDGSGVSYSGGGEKKKGNFFFFSVLGGLGGGEKNALHHEAGFG